MANHQKMCEFMCFMFDCNVKLSKLFHSMCFLKEIGFFSCDFTFEGDLQINKLARFSWDRIWIEKCTFTSHTFKNVLKILAQIAKTTEFYFEAYEFDIAIDDTECYSLYEELGMEYTKSENNLIKVQDCSCESTCILEAVNSLE